MAGGSAIGRRTGCPVCGARLSPVARFCGTCGTSFEIDRLCPSCGARLPQDAAVCARCQALLDSDWSCPVCGAAVAANASMCNQCGTVLAPAVTPPATNFARPKRSRSCAVVTLVCILLLCGACISVVTLGLALDLPTKVEMNVTGRVHEVGGPKEAWDETTQKAAVEKVAAAFETALRARDAEEAATLIDPELQAAYSEAFAAHRDELPGLADILATRKLVSIINPFAEYEVSDGGRKSSIRFILIDGHWFLASL